MSSPITQIKPVLKKEKTRLLILDKAAQMFSRQGYQSTSLKGIATAANMKAGSLYYHFPSKEALMTEVLDKSIQFISDTVGEEIEQLDDGYTFTEGLKAYIRGHLTAILKHPDYTTTTIRNNGQIPKAVQLAVRVKREHYEQQWRKLMTQGKAEGVIRKDVDEQLLRLMILGCLNWSSVWYKPNGDSINTLVEQYTDVFLNGCQ
ncbi:MAG: TetR family transcriptional regulator [Cycloclasticus sp.]|nr:MAG: TetR family transcriptional regulator [Cycloclasticus sp.]